MTQVVHQGTKIGPLLEQHPELIESLASYAPEYERLRSPLMRKTFGRLATLADAARLAKVDPATLVTYVNRLLAGPAAGPAGVPSTAQEAGAGGAPRVVAVSREGRQAGGNDYRVDELKAMLRELHAGRTAEEVAARFGRLLAGVSASEIAEAEQQLVADGLPEEEIKRLCDVHAAVFRGSPEQQVTLDLHADHPLAALRAENQRIIAAVGSLTPIVADLQQWPARDALVRWHDDLLSGLDQLGLLEEHYVYIENRLFPILERYGAEAPPKVMWAVHDDVRELYKRAVSAAQAGDVDKVSESLPELLRQVSEMVMKEEQVLFPLCLDLFEGADWARLQAGEESGHPSAEGYRTAEDRRREAEATRVPLPPEQDGRATGVRAGARAEAEDRGAWAEAEAGEAGVRAVDLPVGRLTPEQLALLFTNLPVDVTYVDEEDQVRFYSEGHRIFPRSPEIIGRKVQNCHPPKSVHIVQRIVNEMRAGGRDVAEFWLDLSGRFIHIRYLALRDAGGAYRGVLEVAQDVTAIRSLEGQRRLLDW